MGVRIHRNAHFERSQDGIVVLDQSGKVVEANQSFANQLGYTLPELGQFHVWDWDAKWTRAELENRLREPSSMGATFETRHRRKDGAFREVEVTLNTIEIRKQTLLYCVHRDITDRKRTEQQKDDAISYSQRLLAASPIGIVTYKASGQTVSANAAAAKLIGTTVETVLTQNFRELDSWKHSGLLKMAELALATGQEQAYKDRIVTTFGKEIRVSTQFVPFRFAGEAHLLMLWLDISERKRAEAAIQDREAQIGRLLKEQQTILEAAPIGIALSKNRTVQWANSAHAAMHGVSPQEMIRLDTKLFYTRTEDYERVGRDSSAQFARGLTYVTEVEFKRTNGETFWCLLQGKAIDRADLSKGVIWMLTDVTEARKAQEDLAPMPYRPSGINHAHVVLHRPFARSVSAQPWPTAHRLA